MKKYRYIVILLVGTLFFLCEKCEDPIPPSDGEPFALDLYLNGDTLVDSVLYVPKEGGTYEINTRINGGLFYIDEAYADSVQIWDGGLITFSEWHLTDTWYNIHYRTSETETDIYNTLLNYLVVTINPNESKKQHQLHFKFGYDRKLTFIQD